MARLEDKMHLLGFESVGDFLHTTTGSKSWFVSAWTDSLQCQVAYLVGGGGEEDASGRLIIIV